MTHRRNLTVLHFNDVYNIEGGTREPVGGAARFAQLVLPSRVRVLTSFADSELLREPSIDPLQWRLLQSFHHVDHHSRPTNGVCS